MSDAPFMQLWVADFVGDTMHLSKAQVGEYLLLLIAMWRNGGTLPNNPKQLARIAKGAVSDAVMAMFDEVAPDCITQKRLQKELERALKKSQARSASGKLGYRAKVLKNKEPAQANATPSLKHLSEPEPETTIVVSLGAKAPTRRKRLPEDWRPSQGVINTLLSEGFSLSEIEAQLVRFRDHWKATGKPMADWDATFRNWVRRSAEMSGRGPGPPPKSTTRQGFDRAFGRIRAHAAATSNQEQTNVVDLSEVRERGEGVPGPPCDVEPSNGRG